MKNIFSIFTKSENTFEGKEIDEKVLLVVRRHPFYIIVKIILSLLLSLLPIAIGIAFGAFIVFHQMIGLFFFLSSLWCLLLWQILFYFITMYILDIWIVTNLRIIDSTQHGFFDRSTSELHLARIQDISVETSGFFQTLLKFGDMEVQTAGTENKFNFLQIPDPNGVKNMIMGTIEGNTPV